MASRIPALPRDLHVQSHAAVHKDNLCDSHSLCVAAIVIACGRTRPINQNGRPRANTLPSTRVLGQPYALRATRKPSLAQSHGSGTLFPTWS
jgi:hypothetical protein